MKSISPKTCVRCNEQFNGAIPVLMCSHFIWPFCYCNLKANRPDQKSNKCGCPECGRNMVRSKKYN